MPHQEAMAQIRRGRLDPSVCGSLSEIHWIGLWRLRPRCIRASSRWEGLAPVREMGYCQGLMSIASRFLRLRSWPSLLPACLIPLLVACAGTVTNQEAEWPPLVKKWYDRAASSLKTGDIQDAQLSSENALRLDAKRPEVRLQAAKIALARLDFDRAVQLTDGLYNAETQAIRGRAFWYAGRVQEAAETLEQLVSNPDIHDTWAVEIARLARRGVGRKPFTITGGVVAIADMPQVGRALLTPVEVDGEPALGMIATGMSETVVDSTGGSEPRWVSLRFGERIEVKDVPAITKDLSSLSRQLNAPVKVMLGINLLRHLHPTIDLYGGQFVVRSYDPPAPPVATVVSLSFARGGAMLVRGSFGEGERAVPATFLVDTAMDVPMALDEGGWKKAGKKVTDLKPLPGSRGMSQGQVPVFGFGTLEIPEVPAISGVAIQEIEKPIEMDLDGVIGAGMLAPFRVTLADAGRTMWLEPMPVDPSMLPPEAAAAEAEKTTPRGDAGKGAPAKPAVPPSRPTGPAAGAPANPSLNAPLRH